MEINVEKYKGAQSSIKQKILNGKTNWNGDNKYKEIG